MDVCRVCLQSAECVPLSHRDLSAFYSACFMSTDDRKRETSVWVCAYCWTRASQCLRFIQSVRKAEFLLRTASQSSLINTKHAVHQYKTTNIQHTVVCNSNYCEKLQLNKPEETEENVFYIQCKMIDNRYPVPEQCYVPEVVLKPEFDENNVEIKEENEQGSSDVKNETIEDIQLEDLEELDQNTVEVLQMTNKKTSPLNILRKSKLTDEQKANLLGYELVLYSAEQQMEEIARKKRGRRYGDAIYKCDKCGLGYQSEPVYKAHVLKRHVKAAGLYECEVCEYRFVTIGLLELHLDEHERKWRCTRCAAIVSRQMWQRHRDDCAADAKQHMCDICNKKCRSKFYLQRHKRIIHETKRQFACDYCGKSWKYKSELEIHVRRHTGEKPYECTQCDMKFISMFQLRTHLNSKHSEPTAEEPLEDRYCVECDRYYKNKQSLEKHLLVSPKHVSPETYKHACNMCTKRFAASKRMEAHMKAVHLNIKEFACSKCDKAFVAVGTLKRHIESTHNRVAKVELPRDHVCDVCGAAFKTKPTLKNHVVAVHEKKRPYVCNTCGATFGFQGTLHTHIKLKHKGEKRNRKTKNVVSTSAV